MQNCHFEPREPINRYADLKTAKKVAKSERGGSFGKTSFGFPRNNVAA